MAYIERIDAGIQPKQRIIFTAAQLNDYLKQIQTEFRFYELEMAEVVEVHLDETKSSFPKKSNGKPNYAYYGGILARYITSEKGKPIDFLKDCKPMNPNLMTYPIVGEIVYVSQLSKLESGNRFYFSPFNFSGSPSQNLKPDISILGHDKESMFNSYLADEWDHKLVVNTGEDKHKTGYYHEPKSYPRLMAEEGDVIIEGRFGNSIRLGSDRETNLQGLDGSKMTLHTGLQKETLYKGSSVPPEKEEFERDQSCTITLGSMTKQIIPKAFTPQVNNFDKYSMSEIFMNSNQIILNSKNNGNIGILSSGNISIGARGETVIESPDSGNIKLGGQDATEPGVLGEELKKVLDILLKGEIQKNTVLIGVNTAAAAVKTTAGDVPGATKLTKQNVELQKLNTEMVQMIAAGPYLSKIVKTK
jgi:hypothetical protein